MSASLSSKEEESLKTLKMELEKEQIIQEGDTIGNSDAVLLRFLRARKFNVQQTKEMIIKCQAWRKNVSGAGIDALYEKTNTFDFPERELIFTHWPLYFHKTDKLGRPLNIETMGGINLTALYADVTPQRHREVLMLIAESLMREVLPACSRKAGHPIETGVVIVDLKGFSLSQFWQLRSIVKDQFQISQDYYPETMGKLVVINAPSTFAYIWSIAKRWLAQETIDKVDIRGSDYRDALLEFIDPESLPAAYGGTCTCDGEGGCMLSNAGPWLNEKLQVGRSHSPALIIEEKEISDSKEPSLMEGQHLQTVAV